MLKILNATIPAASSICATGVRLVQWDCVPVAFGMPTGWTGTTMMTFQASSDGATYSDLYFSAQTGAIWGSKELILAVASSEMIGVANQDAFNVQFLKVRAGTSAAAVTVAEDQKVEIIVKTSKG